MRDAKGEWKHVDKNAHVQDKIGQNVKTLICFIIEEIGNFFGEMAGLGSKGLVWRVGVGAVSQIFDAWALSKAEEI